MILPPNINVQLIDPQTGLATSFFTKFLASLAANFGISNSVPFSPGAIGPGNATEISVPLPNVVVGQPAAAAFSQPVLGIQPIAFVFTPGIVVAGLLNTTGGTLTPAAGTITVMAWTP